MALLRFEHVRRRLAANLEWPGPAELAPAPPRSGRRAVSPTGQRLKGIIRRFPRLGWLLLRAVRLVLLPVALLRRLNAPVARLERAADRLAEYLRQRASQGGTHAHRTG